MQAPRVTFIASWNTDRKEKSNQGEAPSFANVRQSRGAVFFERWRRRPGLTGPPAALAAEFALPPETGTFCGLRPTMVEIKFVTRDLFFELRSH